MRHLLLLTLMFPFCSFAQIFSFSENSPIFINQTYVCGETSYPAQLVSIELLKGGDVSICIKIEGVEKFYSRADIHDLHAEFFGNGRRIALQNECEFHFEVTGNTPKDLENYFKDVYWGRK